MQIFLNQYIMHYLNHTLTLLASYGDKPSVLLTVSTFSRKILKSAKLNVFLCFIALKLSKLQIKLRLRTVFLWTNILLINYLQFLLLGFYFHQCFAIIKDLLPLKRNLSVQTTSNGKNPFVYVVIKTGNDIQKKMKGVMLNTFSLVKLKLLII